MNHMSNLKEYYVEIKYSYKTFKGLIFIMLSAWTLLHFCYAVLNRIIVYLIIRLHAKSRIIISFFYSLNFAKVNYGKNLVGRIVALLSY